MGIAFYIGLKRKIIEIEKELNKDVKEYEKEYKDFIKKNTEDRYEISKKIKNKKDEELKEILHMLKSVYNDDLDIMKNLKIIFKNKTYRKILKSFANGDKSLLEKIKEPNILKLPSGFRAQKHLFSQETIHEYISKNEDNKIVFSKKGKKMMNVLRSKFNGKNLLNELECGWDNNNETYHYIITKNGKFFKGIIASYYGNYYFCNEKIKNWDQLIENSIDIKLEDWTPSGFIAFNDNEVLNGFIHNANIYFNPLNDCKHKRIIKNILRENKTFSSLCSVMFDFENPEAYVMQYFDENDFYILKINLKNKEKITVENIITQEKNELSKLIAYEQNNDTDKIMKDLFCEEIEEIKTIKPNIMIVGGNWSEDSRKKVFKDYNATFVSLEEYERYSEKSKNADYIFIDTSANTHSNTYKAKSIHDNVKLISRSKKGEIDKWIK